MRISESSTDMTQQEFLQSAKTELQQAYPGLTWDRFADLVGIARRSFKTYRMPELSADFRTMDEFKRKAVEDLLKKARRRAKKQ